MAAKSVTTDWKEKAKRAIEEQELRECTFAPQLVTKDHPRAKTPLVRKEEEKKVVEKENVVNEATHQEAEA